MNVVDSLVVTLGLDPTAFKQGAKDAADAQKKIKDDSVASGKAVEASADKAAESIASLGRKFLGLYALLTAGRGIKEFVSDITSADAALGRTAKNLDISGRNLSAWQGAAIVAGGSAEGITGTLKGLTSEMQKAALTGQSGIIPVFRALGINLADAKGHARDATEVLRDLNKVYNERHIDPARFTELSHMAGVDDGTIALLEKSTAEFNKLINEQQKYAATAEDIDAAQKRQSGWRELLLTSESLGRTILTALTPAITTAMTAVQKWADANQDWIKTNIVEYAEQFANWIKSVDWAQVGAQFATIASNVKDIAVAFANAVNGVNSGSPLFIAFEAFGAMLATSVLLRLSGISLALRALGTVPIPAVLGRLLGLAVGPAAVIAGATAESTPDAETQAKQAQWYKDHPDAHTTIFGAIGEWWRGSAATWLGGNGSGATDREADLDHQRAAQREAEAKAGAKPSTGSWWGDIKRLVGLGDDPKVKEGIADTAKATGEIRDILKAQRDGIGGDAASGGGGGGNRFGFGGSGGGFGRAARGGGGMGGGGPSAITKQEQKNNASVAADELRKAGAPDEGIAAVLGSMQTESSFKPRAHNDVSGGHNGLWQWDSTRWPKVAAWIKSQGGDPWDARWQTKAYIAEGRAKPGDPLYDTSETSAGFRDVMGSKGNLKQAVTGVRRSERFGIGEEGGREANAGKWLGHLPGPAAAPSDKTSASPSVSSALPRNFKPPTPYDLAGARSRIAAGQGDAEDKAWVSYADGGGATKGVSKAGPEVNDHGRGADAPKTRPRTYTEGGGAMPSSVASDGMTTVDHRDPRFAPAPPAPVTYDHVAQHLLKALAHARTLTHQNDNHPVPVILSDKSGKEMLNDRHWSAVDQHLKATHRHLEKAFGPQASAAHYRNMVAMAGGSYNSTSNVTHHHIESRIGEMHVHPQTGDGREFAGQFRDDMRRRGDVTQANFGLA